MVKLYFKEKVKRKYGKILGDKFTTIDGKTIYIEIADIPRYLKYIHGGKLILGKYLRVRGVKSYIMESKGENKSSTLVNEYNWYLKWANEEVGIIYEDGSVTFTNCNINSVVKITTQGKSGWNKGEFLSFLAERVVSKSRRDIERILFRAGLSEYDPLKIAKQTYALNTKDLFWITDNKQMTIEEALKIVFKDIFKKALDKRGGTIESPEGQNIKSYGISKGNYGILKQRLNGVVTDAESEVAVYRLSKILNIDVCPAWFVSPDVIFSQFVYNFSKEFLVHVRRYFKDGERTGELYGDLINKFPSFKDDIDKMCLLDYITRQDDRHLSNIAILHSGNKETFYPLYDNGRSLFYESSEREVAESIKDVVNYSTTFGEIGTYYEAVEKIAHSRDIKKLINLNITESQILKVLKDSGIQEYRLEGNLKWILNTLKVIKTL